MPENWKTYKFSELFETASGLSKSRDQFGFGSPFLTFKDVFYNYFLPSELGDLANTSENEQIRGSVKRGDIFLTRTSETLHELGMSSVALKDYPHSTFNGFCKRLRQKKGLAVKIHPEFIGYFLRSNSFRNEVSSHATMTTRASLNNTSISSLSVILPPFTEQVEIGEILKSLDDKIELNLQMNKTLEEMAMALYKHWFVDFGPFQDGEFVDSEFGEIPKGWEVKNLKEFINVKNGYAFKGKDFIEEGIPVLKIKNVKAGKILLQNLAFVSKEVAIKASRAKIEYEDILITMTGNRQNGNPDTWVGKAALFLRRGEFYLNQRVSILKVKPDSPISKFYLSTMLATEDFQYYFISNSTSSGGQANISPDLIYSTPIIVPPKKEMDKFHHFVGSLIKQTALNEEENENLIKLRDTLLPKLISGEVRVKDVEKTLSEVL